MKSGRKRYHQNCADSINLLYITSEEYYKRKRENERYALEQESSILMNRRQGGSFKLSGHGKGFGGDSELNR